MHGRCICMYIVCVHFCTVHVLWVCVCVCVTFIDPLVLKARHLHVSGSACLLLGLGLPKLAMGWLPLKFSRSVQCRIIAIIPSAYFFASFEVDISASWQALHFIPTTVPLDLSYRCVVGIQNSCNSLRQVASHSSGQCCITSKSINHRSNLPPPPTWSGVP